MICIKYFHSLASMFNKSVLSFSMNSLIVCIANTFSCSVGICFANFTKSEMINNFSNDAIQFWLMLVSFKDESISILVFSKVATLYLCSMNSQPTELIFVK